MIETVPATATATPTTTTARSASFRWKAFGIHLAISLMILAGLLYLLFFIWFPDYLFDTDGGWQALRVIAGVDIVLGPMLTLIAANPQKTAAVLRRDFAIIALIQTLALGGGTWLAWDNRPQAVFWVEGMFYSLPRSAFADEPAARAALSRMPGDDPKQVTIAMPASPIERSEIFAAVLKRGSSVQFEPALYRPFNAQDPAIAGAAARYLAELPPATRQALIDQGVDMAALEAGRLLLIPTFSRYRTYHVLVDAADSTVATAIRVKPNTHIRYSY